MTDKYKTTLSPNFCDCPSWKYMRKPVHARQCKHILKLELQSDVKRSTKEKTNKNTQKSNIWEKKGTKPKIMLYSDNRKLIQDMWLSSEKIDGVRGRWTGEKMVSRGGLVIDIPDRIRSYLPGDIKLDGEFATTKRKNLRVAINATQSDKHSKYWKGINFYVFDVYNHKPFTERYELIKDYPHFCKQTPIKLNKLTQKLKSVCEKGGEGLVIRNPNGLYKTYGRSNDVVKVKPTYQGQALYIGNNRFKEIGSGVEFYMKVPKDTNPGCEIRFHYNDRTSRNKPKNPISCQCE